MAKQRFPALILRISAPIPLLAKYFLELTLSPSPSSLALLYPSALSFARSRHVVAHANIPNAAAIGFPARTVAVCVLVECFSSLVESDLV